jgi:hypothetical protein
MTRVDRHSTQCTTTILLLLLLLLRLGICSYCLCGATSPTRLLLLLLLG